MTQVCSPYIPAVPPTPAVPATPGQFVITNNIGWNSGGRSINYVAGDGGYSFSVNSSAVGVVVGLNDIDTGDGYYELEHSLYFSHGRVQVYESGVFAANVGDFATSDVFSIIRSGITVSYLKNGATVWVSTTPSSGSFFLDTSLYFAGDSVINAAIADITLVPTSVYTSTPSSINVSLPSSALGYGGYTNIGFGESQASTSFASAASHGWSTNTSCASTAQGFQGIYAQGIATSLPSSAVGGVLSSYSYNISLPSLSDAYAGQYAIGVNISSASTAQGTGGMPQPAWAETTCVSMLSTTYATGLTGEIGGQTTAESAPSWSRGSNFPTGEGAELSAASIAISGVLPDNWVTVELPAVTGSATITEQPINGAAVTLPPITVSAFSGASVGVLLPRVTAIVTGTVQSTLRADVTLPALLATAFGTAGGIASAVVSLPAVTASAYGGGNAAGILPSLTSASTGKAGGIASAAGTLPSLTGSATVTPEAHAEVIVALPALTCAPSGQAWLTLPALTGYAVMNQVVAVTYEAYAVNLTTGAVTHYTNYPFDNILRFGNKYYGVASDGIYELTGNLDVTLPIDARIKTFQTNFGTQNYKRIPYVYSSGRSDGGVTISVTADEGDTYDYDSQWGEVTGNTNHRSAVGRGLRGIYYSLGVSNINGGSLELDALAVPVVPTTRGV